MHSNKRETIDRLNEVMKQRFKNQGKFRNHVVILGAGASKAACPVDRNGVQIPLMNDLFKLIDLDSIRKRIAVDLDMGNFENFYSQIYNHGASQIVDEIDLAIRNFFSKLEIPEHLTIYDYLLISLRQGDAIATFNWDPFLLQAYHRISKITKNLPFLFFLHGNVSAGYCPDCSYRSHFMNRCKGCGKRLTPSPLLFPVTNKNYQNNMYTRNEWEVFKGFFQASQCITVFGYSAPQTDVEARKILKDALGDTEELRKFDDMEIIDINDEEKLKSNWSEFYYSYENIKIYKSFYDSMIAKFPRRSVEAHIIMSHFGEWPCYFEIRPDMTFEDLCQHIHPLLSADVNYIPDYINMK